jgi:hypothetical protein
MDSTPDARSDRLWGLLEDALRRLAADPPTQLAFLVELFHGQGLSDVDELAVELDDVWPAAGTTEGSPLRAETVALVNAVDQKLRSMSGSANAPLWTLEALATSPDWAIVRGLARDALGAVTSDIAER